MATITKADVADLLSRGCEREGVSEASEFWMGRTDGGLVVHIGTADGDYGADVFQTAYDSVNGRRARTYAGDTLKELLDNLAADGLAISVKTAKIA